MARQSIGAWTATEVGEFDAPTETQDNLPEGNQVDPGQTSDHKIDRSEPADDPPPRSTTGRPVKLLATALMSTIAVGFVAFFGLGLFSSDPGSDAMNDPSGPAAANNSDESISGEGAGDNNEPSDFGNSLAIPEAESSEASQRGTDGDEPTTDLLRPDDDATNAESTEADSDTADETGNTDDGSATAEPNNPSDSANGSTDSDLPAATTTSTTGASADPSPGSVAVASTAPQTVPITAGPTTTTTPGPTATAGTAVAGTVTIQTTTAPTATTAPPTTPPPATAPPTTTPPTTAPAPLPDTLIASPSNGAGRPSNATVRFSANSVPGASTYCWTFQPGGYQVCRPQRSFTLPAGSDQVGPGTVTVVAEARGNAGQQLMSEEIRIDLIPPVSIAQPTATDWIDVGSQARLQANPVPNADRYCWTFVQNGAVVGSFCSSSTTVNLTPGGAVLGRLSLVPVTIRLSARQGSVVLGEDSVQVPVARRL